MTIATITILCTLLGIISIISGAPKQKITSPEECRVLIRNKTRDVNVNEYRNGLSPNYYDLLNESVNALERLGIVLLYSEYYRKLEFTRVDNKSVILGDILDQMKQQINDLYEKTIFGTYIQLTSHSVKFAAEKIITYVYGGRQDYESIEKVVNYLQERVIKRNVKALAKVNSVLSREGTAKYGIDQLIEKVRNEFDLRIELAISLSVQIYNISDRLDVERQKVQKAKAAQKTARVMFDSGTNKIINAILKFVVLETRPDLVNYLLNLTWELQSLENNFTAGEGPRHLLLMNSVSTIKLNHLVNDLQKIARSSSKMSDGNKPDIQFPPAINTLALETELEHLREILHGLRTIEKRIDVLQAGVKNMTKTRKDLITKDNEAFSAYSVSKILVNLNFAMLRVVTSFEKKLYPYIEYHQTISDVKDLVEIIKTKPVAEVEAVLERLMAQAEYLAVVKDGIRRIYTKVIPKLNMLPSHFNNVKNIEMESAQLREIIRQYLNEVNENLDEEDLSAERALEVAKARCGITEPPGL